MSSLLTQFRQYIAATLAEELQIPFRDGMTRGPLEQKDIGKDGMGFTAVVRVAEDAEIVREGVEVHIAIYRPFRQRKSNLDVIDPAPFEDLIEQVQTVAGKHQASGGAWYWRITEAVPDYDKGCVDFLAYGITDNPSTVTPVPV